jgi:CRISPR-associated protein Csm5
LSKKEYIFDQRNGKVHMPDLARLTGFLAKHSLLPEFEHFMFQSENNNLHAFLSDIGIKPSDYPAFVTYTIDAGEVADSEHFRGVLTFMKNADGKPYIPGSSLKGAIRTAIAAKLMKKGNWDRIVQEIERAADDFRGPRYYVSKEARNLENRVFNKLDLKDPRNPEKIKWYDIVNDFMRGIRISDSEPINFDNLTLCGKYDRKPDGEIIILPIYRECLVPNTTTKLLLTIDKPVLEKFGIDILFIEDALRDFSNAYQANYEQYFAGSKADAKVKTNNGAGIILGGGAGYAAKTLVYPLIPDQNRALRLVSKMMTKQFPKHRHEKDTGAYKISPHILKTTRYKNAYYHMGKCELFFK